MAVYVNDTFYDDIIDTVIERSPYAGKNFYTLIGMDRSQLVADRSRGHAGEDGKVHAILGASSAPRWMVCAGSVRMSKGMPNRSSPYAQEGTCAHHLGEMSLAADVSPFWWVGQWINATGALFDERPESEDDDAAEVIPFEIDDDMATAVEMYVDHIKSVHKKLAAEYGEDRIQTFLEKGFDLTALYPDMYGTNDYSFFVSGEILIVIDYKHGKGKAVEIRDNEQLLYYALGALLELCKSKAELPKQIITTIVQPRLKHRDGPIRSWAYTIDEVVDFSTKLVAAAILTEDENAPLVPGEEQCFFCNGKARPCPALFDRAQELALADFTDISDDDLIVYKTPTKTELSEHGKEIVGRLVASTVSNTERLRQVLLLKPVLDAWLRDISAYAQHEHENGRPISNDFKLVRRRTNRRHRDEAESIKELRSLGVSDDDIFKPAVVRTPAQLEKMKLDKQKLSALFYHPPGQLTLVPASDARPAEDIRPFEDLTPDELTIEGSFEVVDEGDWDIL